MPSALLDTISMIDSCVKLKSNGQIRTVEQILIGLDVDDTTEYVLGKDDLGRFIICQVDQTGYQVNPPMFVEERTFNTAVFAADKPDFRTDKNGQRWYA